MSGRPLFGPLAILALFGVLAGCGGGGAPTDLRVQGPPAGASPLADTQLEEIPTSGFLPEAGYELIRTPAEWEAYWRRIHRHLAPEPPLPQVDFSGHLLLAVAMGERPSGGHAIRVEDVHVQDANYWVTLARVSPGPGCLSTSVITGPVTVVRMPAPSGTVELLYRDVTVDCRQ